MRRSKDNVWIKNEEIKETGTLNLNGNGHKANIQLLTIIGEIEGHEAVSGNTKATKYEHLIPRLAEVEDDDEVDWSFDFTQYTGR